MEDQAASSSDDEEAVGIEQFRLANIKDRPPIFNADALHEAYEDFAWEAPADWTETQVITLESPIEVDDVNDDLARELAFYHAAQAATKEAIERFEEADLAWQRPPDYYAECVKSDAHMARVKEQLMHEQRLIEEAEQRRKNREAKAYSKQVQAEKLKERQRAKKEQIADVTRLRKQRAASGYAGELDFDKVSFGGGTQGSLGQRIKAGGPDRSKKRQKRDAKFGFGGRKKLMKQNTAESSADMNAMGVGRGKQRGPGVKGASRGGKAGVQKVKKRPGRTVRQKQKGRG